MQKNAQSEVGRVHCKHNIAHALDVARIAYIISLEDRMGLLKEHIYAAALLHDITKWQQHASGIAHNESAVEPAGQILKDCAFEDADIAMICRAIHNHREGPADAQSDPFSFLIFRADKLSRACYCCEGKDTCSWDDPRKNLAISY